MKVKADDYVDAFADATKDIIETLMPVTVKRKDSLRHKFLVAEGISAMIHLSGNLDGCVILDIEQDVAKSLAGFMNGVKFDAMDDLAIDSICELTNMIVGKAVTNLNNKGHNFKMTPPCFFNGKKTYPYENTSVSLSTSWGDVSIKVAIKEPRDGILFDSVAISAR